jgi:hypothetical protein
MDLLQGSGTVHYINFSEVIKLAVLRTAEPVVLNQP